MQAPSAVGAGSLVRPRDGRPCRAHASRWRERQPKRRQRADGCRSSHAADATIRAMIPGGALLVALLLQSASAAPGAAPEAPIDEGAPRCARRRRLHLARRSGGARRGPFAAHPVRRRRRGFRADVVAHVGASRQRRRGARPATARRRAAPAPVRRAIVRRGGRRDRAHHRRDPRSDGQARNLQPTSTPNAAERQAAGGRRRCRRRHRPPLPPPGRAAPPATVEAAAPAPSAPSGRTQRSSASTSPARRSSVPRPSVMPGVALTRWPRWTATACGRPRCSSARRTSGETISPRPGGTASFTLDAASRRRVSAARAAGRGSPRGRARPRWSGGWRERRRHRAGGERGAPVRDRGRRRSPRAPVRPSSCSRRLGARRDAAARLLRVRRLDVPPRQRRHDLGQPGRRPALALTLMAAASRQSRPRGGLAGCPDAPRRTARRARAPRPRGRASSAPRP